MISISAESAIHKAISRGEAETVLYEELDVKAIEYLEGCGYYVELLYNERGEIWTYIAWSKQ